MVLTGTIPTHALHKLVTVTLLVGVGLVTSCRTTAELPQVDFTEPGWTVHVGQAVWRPAAGSEEIVGEVVLAVHPDGRSLAQFNKNPLPLLEARIEGDQWQLTQMTRQRATSGRGQPPTRAIWLHLAAAFRGSPPTEPLRLLKPAAGPWSLSNPVTGEVLSIYLNP